MGAERRVTGRRAHATGSTRFYIPESRRSTAIQPQRVHFRAAPP